MKKIIILVSLVISVSQFLIAQDYFPLHIGNKFVFRFHRYIPPNNLYGYTVMRITDTTRFLNKKYYFCMNSPLFFRLGSPSFINRWVRVDSITKSLYAYDSTNSCTLYDHEILVDSLGMTAIGLENSCNNYTCYGRSNDTCFNTISYKVGFHYIQYSHSEDDKTYNKNFGLKSRELWVFGYYYYEADTFLLKGGIINGIVFGDTLTTGIIQLNNYIPNEITLNQNFPNPFNSTTKIRFQLPVVSFSTLKIFDITGKKVATLVNEKLQPGVYEVEWNGTNFASGIFFYRLTAGNFSETKKMLMIK